MRTHELLPPVSLKPPLPTSVSLYKVLSQRDQNTGVLRLVSRSYLYLRLSVYSKCCPSEMRTHESLPSVSPKPPLPMSVTSLPALLAIGAHHSKIWLNIRLSVRARELLPTACFPQLHRLLSVYAKCCSSEIRTQESLPPISLKSPSRLVG